MDFDLTEEQKAWRQEIRDYIRDNATPELFAAMRKHRGVPFGAEYNAWRKKLGEKGWLGIGWPKQYGGQGKSAVEQWILADELDYAGLKIAGPALGMVGQVIMQVGSEELKNEYLPRILSGEIEFVLGYTEPNAGSDLASLETRAVLDGDEIVINGNKVFSSYAHACTHVWLATRTDLNVPKHKGISLVIVPIDTPGITIRPIWTWGDERTNEVFYDDVRVPRQNLVGELNRGWYHLATALDHERVHIGRSGDILRLYEEIVAYAKETERNGRALSKDPVIRQMLASLAIDLQTARLLALRNVTMIDKGRVPNAEASIVKVFNSELRLRMADVAMQIMGRYGQLATGSKLAPLNGDVELSYRLGPLQCISGGTNEIQRNIIARRGLGLP